MSYSPLVSYVALSPNTYGMRNHVIDTVSIHCMACGWSVQRCGSHFANPAVEASSNYGIDGDGRIACYVDEDNCSWCTCSDDNDNRAITIEVANSGDAAEGWPVSDAAYAALLDLLTDICIRNNIKRLLWQWDKSLIGQVDKQNMTVHRWFAAKACPGDYLYNLHGEIAAAVNKRLIAREEDQIKMDLDGIRESLTDCAGTGDKPSDWAKDATDWAKKNGIINGDGAGNFGWQQTLTREGLAQVLFNLHKSQM